MEVSWVPVVPGKCMFNPCEVGLEAERILTQKQTYM